MVFANPTRIYQILKNPKQKPKQKNPKQKRKPKNPKQNNREPNRETNLGRRADDRTELLIGLQLELPSSRCRRGAEQKDKEGEMRGKREKEAGEEYKDPIAVVQNADL